MWGNGSDHHHKTEQRGKLPKDHRGKKEVRSSMQSRTGRSWIAGLLAFVLIASLGLGAQAANTWTAGKSTSDFPTVREALLSSDVKSGDTITVESWASEPLPVDVNKGVTIQCTSSTGPLKVLNSHVGITVRANGAKVLGCEITSATITPLSKQGDIGILVKDVTSGVVIDGNRIHDLLGGILLLNADGVTVSNNRIWNIGQTTINGRRAGVAIALQGSDGNTLSGNKVLHTVDSDPTAFQKVTRINHCGEGLSLFLSDGNTVSGDIYAGCATNGVTLNDSDNNTLTGLMVTDNGGWGFNLSLSNNNKINDSVFARNKMGGGKLEGAQNNQVSEPDKEGNLFKDNGDGAGEDIQLVVTSGEKVLFTAPQIFYDGAKPDDPFQPLRDEEAKIKKKIDRLFKKVEILDRGLDVLTGLLDAEAGILQNIKSQLIPDPTQTKSVKTAFQARLDEKQYLIAELKILILGCMLGEQNQVGGGFFKASGIPDLPDWELNNEWVNSFFTEDDATPGLSNANELAAFCNAHFDDPSEIRLGVAPDGTDIGTFLGLGQKPGIDLTGDQLNPFGVWDLDGDNVGETYWPFEGVDLTQLSGKYWGYHTIEDEKAEIKDEIDRQGTGSPDDPKGLKQKVEELLGQGSIEPALANNLLQKLDTAVGLVLDINAELNDIIWKLVVADWLLPTPAEKDACFSDTNPVACFQGLLTKATPPGNITFPNLPETTAPKSVIDAKLWVEEARKEKLQITDGTLDPNSCEVTDFFTFNRGDKFDCLKAIVLEFSREIPVVFEINCVDIFKRAVDGGGYEFDTAGDPEDRIGCLVGKKEQGGNSIDGLGVDNLTVYFGLPDFQKDCEVIVNADPDPTTPTDISVKCDALVAALNNDPNAGEWRQLLAAALNNDNIPGNELPGGEDTGTYLLADLMGHKTSNRVESTGNVIANNAFHYNPIRSAPGCNIPEKHPVLGSIWRASCSIAIKVESPLNDFVNNWITNEDIFTADGDPTARGEFRNGKLSIGIVVLADYNQFVLNTCEEVNVCVIKGGNNDREDVQHEYLFKKLATSACDPVAPDPIACENPTEKVLVLEVVDEPIFVAKPDLKCPEKAEFPRPGQVDCSQSPGYAAGDTVPIIIDLCNNYGTGGTVTCGDIFVDVIIFTITQPNTFLSKTVVNDMWRLNFFEKRQAFDIVDSESNTYEENLLLESDVLVRKSVNCATEKWEKNDFKNLTLSYERTTQLCNGEPNWQGSPPDGDVETINWSAPAAQQTSEAFCTRENFGNQAKFAGIQLLDGSTLSHYFGTTTIDTKVTGNLPPVLTAGHSPAGQRLLPAEVELPPIKTPDNPQGKPRTCDAAGVNQPVPGPGDGGPVGTLQEAMAQLTTAASTAAQVCPAIRDGLMRALRGDEAGVAAAQEAAAACSASVKDILESAADAKRLLSDQNVGSAALSRMQQIGDRMLDQLLKQAERIFMDLGTCETELAGVDPNDRRSMMGALRSCLRPAAMARVLKIFAQRADQFLGAGLTIEALAVERVQVARAFGSVYTFTIEGQGIQTVELAIFDASGRPVFSAQSQDRTLRFLGLDQNGQRLANGVYLAVVTVKGFNGDEIRKIQKIMILR